MTHIVPPAFKIIQGDALQVLQEELADKIVHSVVTSPPYYKKRTYGNDAEREIGWNSLNEYIKSLCDVFNAVPLHHRGSIWVNLGDTRTPQGGLHMVPYRFALAMQEDGWLVADEVIWAKILDQDDGSTVGCCMTEPAPGRLNGNGYEVLFRFTKGNLPFVKRKRKVGEAYADTCAVAIPRHEVGNKGDTRYLPSELMETETSIEGRNLHNIWQVSMGQTREKHYAVYPPALCERPIAMTCPHLICSECGEPHQRIVEKVEYDEGKNRNKRMFGKYTAEELEVLKEKSGRMDSGKYYVPRKPVTRGWSPSCQCDSSEEPITGTVLDPFMGSGSTGEAALKLGRNFIGIDLYQSNLEISQKRLEKVQKNLIEKGLDPRKLIR